MIRRLLILPAVLLVLAAFAAPSEFHRWQFGEFAAALRYLQYGEATPGINDIFVREIRHFVRTEDVRIGTVHPQPTLGTLDGSWIFFGARFAAPFGVRTTVLLCPVVPGRGKRVSRRQGL